MQASTQDAYFEFAMIFTPMVVTDETKTFEHRPDAEIQTPYSLQSLYRYGLRLG